MYRGLKCAVAYVGFFALAACGGGGGGPGSTPTPPVSTAGTFPLRSSEPFQTIDSSRVLTGSGNMLSGQSGVTGQGPFVTISYDSASGTYTVTNNAATANLGSADRTTSGYYDVYTKQTNGVTDELKLYGNARVGGSQAGSPVTLTYASFGTWTQTGASGEIRKHHFVFGYPTAPGSMPRTGSASYQTLVSGSMMEGGVSYPNTYNEVGGTATFSADFGAATVSTQLNLIRVGNGQSLGNYSGAGTIYGSNLFHGTFATGSTSVSGAFEGGFFGPSATEMGYSFYIYRNNPDPYAGASVAPQHTYINGVVVGKKN